MEEFVGTVNKKKLNFTVDVRWRRLVASPAALKTAEWGHLGRTDFSEKQREMD